MTLWDKLRQELDRAGRVAQGALDEGRLRLDVMRARQAADKAAQALGYAVYRARQDGKELDAETYARLSSTLAAREAEAKRLEERLKETAARRADRRPAGDRTAPESPPPSTADQAPRGGGAEPPASAAADRPGTASKPESPPPTP